MGAVSPASSLRLPFTPEALRPAVSREDGRVHVLAEATDERNPKGKATPPPSGATERLGREHA